MDTISSGYTFYQPPPPVGYWVFPGSAPSGEFIIMLPKRPRWLTRKFMSIFEFEWRDNE